MIVSLRFQYFETRILFCGLLICLCSDYQQSLGSLILNLLFAKLSSSVGHPGKLRNEKAHKMSFVTYIDLCVYVSITRAYAAKSFKFKFPGNIICACVE